MSKLFPGIGRYNSPRTANVATWGVIGLCGAAFAYTFSAEQTLRSHSYSMKERQEAAGRVAWSRSNLMFSAQNVHEGRWWTPLTATFCHGSVAHFAFNMTTFYSFAPGLIRGIGLGPFAALYLGGGVFSSVIAGLDKPNYSRPSLGASGGICALIAFASAARPDMKLSVMGVIPMRGWQYCIAFGLLSILFQETGTLQGVGHLAHLGGLAYGPAFLFALRAVALRGR